MTNTTPGQLCELLCIWALCTLNSFAFDETEIIRNAVISYQPDLAFRPGYNFLLFRVEEGAPCRSYCTLLRLRKTYDIVEWSNVTNFEVYIETSIDDYRASVKFQTAGTYRVSCKFQNTVSFDTAQISIIVNELYHPISLETNSPVAKGGELSVHFDLGRWNGARAVHVESYFNTTFFDSVYRLGKSQKFTRIGLSKGFVLTKVVNVPGTMHLRFNLDIEFKAKDMYTVQMVTPVTVLDDILSVHLNVLWGQTPDIFKKSFTLMKNDIQKATIKVPNGENVVIEGTSENLVTSWEWGSFNKVLSRESSFDFVSYSPTVIEGIARNQFYSMDFKIMIEPLLHGKELLILTHEATKRGESAQFSIVIASYSAEKESSADLDLAVSVELSRGASGRMEIISKKAIQYDAKDIRCYENSGNLLKSYLETWRKISSSFNPDHDKIKSFCVLKFTHEFTESGSYNIAATARNGLTVVSRSNGMCVSASSTCNAVSIKILTPPAVNKIFFEAGQDIHLVGEIKKINCPENKKKPVTLRFSWNLSRFKVGYETFQSSNPRDFFDRNWNIDLGDQQEVLIQAHQLPVGSYVAYFQVTEKLPYCLQQQPFASDPLFITILPPPFRATIYGGQQSVQYVEPSANVMLKSGIQYNPQNNTKVEYSWFCRMKNQEIQFMAYMESWRTTGTSGQGGCFGKGFLEKTTDINTLLVPALSFLDKPNTYVFRLVVTSDGREAFDDHILELKEANAQEIKIINMLKEGIVGGNDENPHVTLECLENCEKVLVAAKILHLEAKCEFCNETSQSFEIIYKWNVQQPTAVLQRSLQNTDLSRNLYKNINIGETNFRMRPSYFTVPGEYKISVKMSVKHKDTPEDISLGEARYFAYVTEELPPPPCFVRPTSGTLLVTKFKIGCHNSSPSKQLLYEMFYSDCYSCGPEDESFTMFYRGYNRLAEGVSLPSGKKKFGYKLVIKIRTTDERYQFFGDSYAFVYVLPLQAVEIQELLTTTLEENLKISGFRQNIVEFGQVAMAALSLNYSAQNESLMYGIVKSILEKMEDMKPASHQTANILTHILEKSLILLSKLGTQSPANILSAIISAEKALSLQVNYILQITHVRHDSDEAEFLAKSCINALSQAIQILTRHKPTLGGGDMHVHNTGPDRARKRLFNSLTSIALALSVGKTFREQLTNIATESLKLSVSKSKLHKGSSLIYQQPGLVFGAAKASQDWSIRSSVSTFFFDPLAKYVDAESQIDVRRASVLGITIDARAVDDGNSPADFLLVQRPKRTRDTAKFLSDRTINVLLRFQEEQLQLSQTITLPNPCSTVDEKLRSNKSSGEPCGHALTTLSFASHYVQRKKRGMVTPVHKNSYIVIRPNRPCRIPNMPCVKVNFMRESSNVTHGNTSSLKLKTQKCNQSGTVDKIAVCVRYFDVLATITFPRNVKNVLPPEFHPDSWSVGVPDAVAKEISDGKIDVVLAVEQLQKGFAPLGDELSSFQSVTLSVVTPTCSMWNENKEEWSSDSCVGSLAEANAIHCECSPSNSPYFLKDFMAATTNMPLFFAAGFIIIPNRIDFTDFLSLFLLLRSNIYVLSFILSCWAVFGVSLVWARKKDDLESAMKGIIISPDNNPTHEFLYEVVLTTAMLRDSGTTATVKMILEGSEGILSEPHEISNKYHTTLRRASKDAFLIATSQSMGQVEHVHLWHDNTGDSASWHVNKISVFDLQDPERSPSYFLVDSWLSQDIYPYCCRVTATRTDMEELLSFKTLWYMYVNNLLDEDDVWLSIFFKSRCSLFTRVQRIACLATAVFGAILVTSMFIENAGSVKYSFSLGFVNIDLSAVIIAIEGSIVTVPLSALHVTVFNRLETKYDRMYDSLLNKREHDLADANYEQGREKYFDTHETLQALLEIKSTIEEFSNNCQRIQEPVSNKLHVRVENKVIAKNTIHAQAFMENKSKKGGSDSDGRHHVWYNRFRIKRLLRQRNERPEDLEDGVEVLDSMTSFHSLPGSADGDTQSLSLNSTIEIPPLLKDIVFLPKARITFPRWTLIIVWALTWMYIITCSGFSLLYGLSYNKEKFVSWLTTLTLSLLQNIFVIAPIRISVVASAIAFMNRNDIDVAKWVVYTGPAARTDAVLRWRIIQKTSTTRSEYTESKLVQKSDFLLRPQESNNDARLHRRRSSVYEASVFRLLKSGKRSLAVRQVKRYWLDTIIWVCIAAFFTSLIVWQRDPRLNRISNRIRDQLKEDVTNIKTKNDVYDFLDEGVIPLVFNMRDYSHLEQTRLLGPIRLRQLRLLERSECFPIPVYWTRRSCLQPDEEVTSEVSYDTSNHSAYWLASDYTGMQIFSIPWRYTKLGYADGAYFKPGSILHRPFYPDGGYIADLGYLPKQAFSMTRSLKHSGWIDRYSAAVFIEFSTFDIVTGHVTAVTYVIEFLASGGLNVFHQSHSYRPVYMYKMKDVTIVALQFLHLGITWILVYSIILEFSESNWRPVVIISLCSDVWRILEIATIIATFSAYGYYMKHLIMADEASQALNKDPSRFVSFSKAAYYNIIYLNLISFAAFLCYLRVLKVMRGSQSVSVMVDTLATAREGVANVAVILGAATIALSLTGFSMFGTRRWNFHKIITASSSITSLAAGMEIPQPANGVTTEIWWSIYFLILTVFVLLFFSNLYATVVSDALFFVRNEAAKERFYQVETLALHWLFENAARFFGIKSNAFSGKRIILRPPPGSILEGDMTEKMRKSLTLDPMSALTKRGGVTSHDSGRNRIFSPKKLAKKRFSKAESK